MEDKIKEIKESLSGDLDSDLNFLNSQIEEKNKEIENANLTIEAINEVLNELTKENEEKEQTEDNELDLMIKSLQDKINNQDDDGALDDIEKIIPKIEALTKNDDNTLYCSFSNTLEKLIFEKIFAENKKVLDTPYANDTIYIIYADLLKKKKKTIAAMRALDRATYWNFFNREAREKKLDIYLDRKEMTKYLDGVKSLQMISYTPMYLADCYNKYGSVFNLLEDNESSYSMFRISYSFYIDENVKKVIDEFEKAAPQLKNMTADQIMQRAEANEVQVGPNQKIIDATRKITSDFVNQGLIEDAKLMLKNDYLLTGSEETANLYNQILEIQNSSNEEVEKKTKTKRKTTTKAKTTKKEEGTVNKNKKSTTKKREKVEAKN